ncbi:MAG: hypothetical protein ONB44_21100 [candidate division KSB1 bacterium]|nr:hypothetical protein [candidate division KSB1 bacterium]MDZ7304632.1 hypothetical protein [candidate division KSB1 bacterium]MDZ7313764.1 hypothetical protein [candidate division KSB1 bacterium]
MKTRSFDQKGVCLLTIVLFFFPPISQAQLISVKSVPVAAAEQFMLVPSQNLGMGGVSIALEDPSSDPFVNPAKGARIQGVYLFSAPVFSNITENNGGVRTLPLGALLGAAKWFGGMTLAIQQSRWNASSALSDKNSNNLYAAGLIGTKIPSAGIAIAASIHWAGLEAMQGVDFLYGRSSRIDQYGHIVDYRIGLLREKTNRPSFEILLLHNRVHMTHEVYYRGWFWEGDFLTREYGTEGVRNLDATNTWGLHVGSMMPLGRDSSRVGLIFTVNHKSHPKIPNYELMNIPRDPGNSWAFNIGTGVSHAKAAGILAMDIVFEPIWSHTWADAAAPVTTERGVIIPAGGKTVENHFRFSNWMVRLGLSQQDRTFGFQLGLQARFFKYRFEQKNFVADTRRAQKEVWGEWTPSIGLSLNYPSFQIRYTGCLTAGTGRPGVESDFGRWPGVLRAGFDASENFIVAPSGSLTLQETIVLTHQISVAVAL